MRTEGDSQFLISNSQFLIVPKAQIAENGEYNLSGERYRGAELRITNYELVTLGEVCTFEYGKPLKEANRVPGNYPVFGSNGVIGFHNEYLVEAPFLVIGRKGSAGEVHYSEQSGTPIDTTFYVKLENEDRILLKYLFHILKTLDLKNVNIQSGVPGLNRNDAYNRQIPLPPLDIQREIVAEIEGYQRVIDGARLVLDNYRPHIPVDPEWPTAKLGEACIFKRGPFGGSLKKEIFVKSGYAVYEQSHAIANDFSEFRYFIDQEKFDEMRGFQVHPGELIMSCSGTMGKVAIIPHGAPPGIINQALLKLSTS